MGDKKTKMIESKALKEVDRLTRALVEEKAVKTEAFKKVQMLRDEMQQQAMGDKASVDGQQWMDRYLACCDQLEVMAREKRSHATGVQGEGCGATICHVGGNR